MYCICTISTSCAFCACLRDSNLAASLYTSTFSTVFVRQGVQKGVGDLAQGALELGGKVAGQVLKNSPEVLERTGQFVDGVLKAKQESKPFVDQVSEWSSMTFTAHCT